MSYSDLSGKDAFEKKKPKKQEADTVACPRCGRKYRRDEWRGECNHCGYPDVYFDTFLY